MTRNKHKGENTHKIKLLLEINNEKINMKVDNKLKFLHLNFYDILPYILRKNPQLSNKYNYYNLPKLIKIPIKVFTLYNLKYLNISNINLKYLPAELSLLTNLKILICLFCNLKNISNINNKLTELNASFNAIKQIKNLPYTLEYLYLDHNKLKIINKNFYKCNKLKFITLNKNLINGVNNRYYINILYCKIINNCNFTIDKNYNYLFIKYLILKKYK